MRSAPVMLGLVMAAGLAMGACDPVPGFLSDTVLPEEREVLAQVDHGQAGREVMAAVFHGDRETVRRRLVADPKLAETGNVCRVTLIVAATGTARPGHDEPVALRARARAHQLPAWP